MTKPYLLISDLDDTLIGDDQALERFARYRDRMRRALKVAYATGRTFDSVARDVRDTPLPEPVAVICNVGTEIRDYATGARDDSWPGQFIGEWSAEAVRDLLSGEPDLEPQPEESQSDFKVSYYLHDAPDERLAEIRQTVATAGIACDTIYSSDRDLDVVPAGVNKGSAAEFLARALDFDLDHVVVAGNSLNDAALFGIGARGIVVANAHDDLKRELGHRDGVYFPRAGFADGVREGLEHHTGSGAAASDFVDEAAYREAVEHLRRCASPEGFWASTIEEANYRRVWGRDSVIMGLAALLSEDPELTQAFRSSLVTLADHQGPHGEVPSNVDTGSGRVSYGGTAGRVDANLWFVIGAIEYWLATGDADFLERLWSALERVIELLGAWEFNHRGLLYVPQTGDWADEYIHSGYVLYDELLYLQALRSFERAKESRTGKPDPELKRKIGRLTDLIQMNYWFEDGEEDMGKAYHEVLYEKGKAAAPQREQRHWMPFFMPSGYGYRFDALANVLVSLFDVADDHKRGCVDDYIERIVPRELALLPAFHPVIKPVNEDYKRLKMTFSYTFKNKPYEFQNGGLWPMITGFYVADLALRKDSDGAREHLLAVHRANAMSMDGQQPCFPEFVHGKELTPGGTPLMGWSAAAAVIGEQTLRGQRLFRV